MALAISAMPVDVLSSSIEECNLCRHIVGAAERHFKPNVTTQDSLKRELDRECVAFSHTHDKNVSRQCIAFVDANIATIFADISAGKRPEAVCVDIQVCQAHPTAAAASAVEEQLAEHNPCNTCTFIIGRAEHHFRPNETAAQLQAKLEKECKRLGQLQGQEAGQHCKQIVDTNIQTIYNDIKAGKRPHQICIDIGECAQNVTAQPVTAGFQHVFAPAPDECHTCEYIIGRAEHHYHNRNVTNENRLLRELEHECIKLAHIEGDQASIKCLDIVRQNIDVIFRDVQNHRRPRDVCIDIGECQASSDGTPGPVTGGPTPSPFTS
uniref:Saposin B-type domain-containing protein n=1 Tax=Panagrolaimus sp. JU765 TaxID=591449 RepID=A0AC34R5I8_9BILA